MAAIAFDEMNGADGALRPAYGEPYLRTYADGIWTDNLLSLYECVQ